MLVTPPYDKSASVDVIVPAPRVIDVFVAFVAEGRLALGISDLPEHKIVLLNVFATECIHPKLDPSREHTLCLLLRIWTSVAIADDVVLGHLLLQPKQISRDFME